MNTPSTSRRNRVLALAALVAVVIALVALVRPARDAGRDLLAAVTDRDTDTAARSRTDVAAGDDTGTGHDSVDDATDDASSRAASAALPVTGVVVDRGPFVLTVRAAGRAEAPRRVELSARVSERVTGVHVTEGDRVRKGDVLVELDRRPFEITLREAEAREANAEVDYRVNLMSDDGVAGDPSADGASRSASNHGTVRTASTGEAIGAASAGDVMARRRELAAHRSGLTEATQAVERARLDLEGARLVAPFDAEIASIDAVSGARVQAGQPVVTLVDLTRLRVPAEVLESDFGRLERGAGATLRFAAFPDTIFGGIVTALSPECDAGTGTGIAYIDIDNPDRRLRPGMYADVEIESARLDDRLAVPRTALLERDRRLLVFRATAGRAEWQYVSTGLESENAIEVTGGLAAGDTVLVGGHLTLAHGAPIRVTLEPPIVGIGSAAGHPTDRGE